jgi:hypothetical protein
LSAGGGFGCIQHANAFNCRLLDYFTADYGQAALPDEPLRAVGFATYDTCIVHLDGSASCFGGNANHNDEIPAGTWTMVSQGDGQACGLHPDGSVECWGNGTNGYTPPPGPFVEVQAIGQAACARDADGVITCWGYDYQGNVAPPPGSWASFIFPNSYLCVLDSEGTITCTGLAKVADAAVPTGTGYHSLTGGFNFACALNAEDRAECWGVDSDGLLDAPDEPFVQIASGDYFTCGLRQDGDVKCWGCREEASSDPERYCKWDDPAPWWVP